MGGSFSLRRIDLESGEELAPRRYPRVRKTPEGDELIEIVETAPKFLIAWDAALCAWHKVGADQFQVDAPVSALAVDTNSGHLYVSGSFYWAGGAPSMGFAIYDTKASQWLMPPGARSRPVVDPLVQLLPVDGRLYARSKAGHVLQFDEDLPGLWKTLPEVPRPLRTASALGWLPRALNAAEANQVGRLVVGGDFLQYGDLEDATTSGSVRGDWYGVAT